MVCAIEDVGFEIRDQIMWIYASGFPKSLDVGWDLHQKASVAGGLMVKIAHGEQTTQHHLRFVLATYLSTPVYACAECGKVLQPFVPQQDAQDHRSAWSKSQACWPEQPGVEGWGDVQTVPRELQGCQICTLPLAVFADGKDRWVRDGAPVNHGSLYWQVPDEDGSRPSYRPQSSEQCARQPDAFRIEFAAQKTRGYGTALKPAHEPIVMARKPFRGTVAANVLQHGTGALNIDGCRVDGEHGKTWETPRGGIWATDTTATARLVDNTVGRWPANVAHDGSDEVLAAFPSAPGQIAAVKPDSGSGQKTNGILGAFATNSDHVPRGDSGSAARFFYSAKASRADRDEGCDNLTLAVADEQHKIPRSQMDDPRRAGTVPRANHHPTVKPVELMRWLCRLVTPKHGIVLDMFMGSGSTGKAAIIEQFDFIGIELDERNADIARARLIHAQGPLFADIDE